MLPDFFVVIDASISDVLLLLCVLPASWFVLSYGLGSPWWRVHKHGWLGVVTFLHSLSVAMLLSLIVYAIVFNQPVGEPVRVGIATLLLFALCFKVAILHYERREGRIEQLRQRNLITKEKAQ